jgi:hypothetical protein
LIKRKRAVEYGPDRFRPGGYVLDHANAVEITGVTKTFGTRIFRVAILMQGKTPKAADLLRWAVRG